MTHRARCHGFDMRPRGWLVTLLIVPVGDVVARGQLGHVLVAAPEKRAARDASPAG